MRVSLCHEQNLGTLEAKPTNGEAAGPSSIESSSVVKDNFGTIRMRNGSNNMMMTGKPIAAVISLDKMETVSFRIKQTLGDLPMV